MSLFDILKNKEVKNESNLLTSIVLFDDESSINYKSLIQHLKDYWGLEVLAHSDSHSFEIAGNTIIVAYHNTPYTSAELDNAISKAYFWPNAEKEVKLNKSYAMIALITPFGEEVDRLIVFTQFVASLLSTSNAIGVYNEKQGLLTFNEFYIDRASLILEELLPVDLWLHIGIGSDKNNNSFCYTSGMEYYNKKNMEIINSNKSVEELYIFMANVLAYVFNYNIQFQNGHRMAYTEDEVITIEVSKGKMIEGDTVKFNI